jgi:hypothetical protein
MMPTSTPPPDDGRLDAVAAVRSGQRHASCPMRGVRNYTVSHQWLRELKRGRARRWWLWCFVLMITRLCSLVTTARLSAFSPSPPRLRAKASCSCTSVERCQRLRHCAREADHLLPVARGPVGQEQVYQDADLRAIKRADAFLDRADRSDTRITLELAGRPQLLLDSDRSLGIYRARVMARP